MDERINPPVIEDDHDRMPSGSVFLSSLLLFVIGLSGCAVEGQYDNQDWPPHESMRQWEREQAERAAWEREVYRAQQERRHP